MKNFILVAIVVILLGTVLPSEALSAPEHKCGVVYPAGGGGARYDCCKPFICD